MPKIPKIENTIMASNAKNTRNAKNVGKNQNLKKT